MKWNHERRHHLHAYGPGSVKKTGNPAYEAIDFKIFLNSDEEIGSPTSKELIANEARGAQTVLVFEPAREGGEYGIQRKGVWKYTLTVTGKAAHAGVEPQKGRSAIVEIGHKIVELNNLTNFSHGYHGKHRYHPGR